MSGSRISPYLGPLIALLVVLALGAGTAYAAIPNGNGKVYACYVKNTGVVRLINYPKVRTCPTGEKLISWNAKGPQGAAGPAGPVGPAGPADWNAIPNKPAGFIDGVDNEGVTKVKLTRTSSSPVSVAPDAWGNAVTDCPIGSKVTGGGPVSSSKLLKMTDSSPTDSGTSWSVWAHNTDTIAHDLYALAVCMSVEPSGAITMAKKGVQPAKLHKKHS